MGIYDFKKGNLINYIINISQNIQNLDIYIDAPITLAKKFALRGVPTTILFDKQGKEFARIMGSIDFNNEKSILLVSLSISRCHYK